MPYEFDMIDVGANTKESNKDLTLIKKCCQKNMNDYFNIRAVWCTSFGFSFISPQKGCCACQALVRQMRNYIWNEILKTDCNRFNYKSPSVGLE